MDENLMGKLLVFVVIVVTIGWMAVFIVYPIITPGFHPAPEVSIAMMGVIGLFAAAYRKSKHPKDGDEDE